jgi:hypothetical protein
MKVRTFTFAVINNYAARTYQHNSNFFYLCLGKFIGRLLESVSKQFSLPRRNDNWG